MIRQQTVQNLSEGAKTPQTLFSEEGMAEFFEGFPEYVYIQVVYFDYVPVQ